LTRWLWFVAGLELFVVAFVLVWFLLFRGTAGLAWAAPPAGLLVGAAAPLQLLLGPVIRAAR
jgi:hypothetical protein